MKLFKKKSFTQTYDKETKKPIIKASICNGEQVGALRIFIQAKSKKK